MRHLPPLRLHFQNPAGQTAWLDLQGRILPPGRELHATVGRVLMQDAMAQLPSGASCEQKAKAKATMVELGTRLQLVSEHTSFVAVSTSTAVQGPLKVRSTSANTP